MTAWAGIAFAVLGVVGQLFNVYLNLKLREAMSDTRDQTLAEVEKVYKRREVCNAEMTGLEKRVCSLGECPLMRKELPAR